MASTITIEIPALGDLLRDLQKAGAYGEQQLKTALRRGAIIIQRAERIEAPRDTSNMANRIDVSETGPLEVTISPRANYSETVHKGRRPGAPVSAKSLEGWARRKGLNPYAVAKSIERKGTKANPFVARAVDDVKGQVNDEFDIAAGKVAEFLARGK